MLCLLCGRAVREPCSHALGPSELTARVAYQPSVFKQAPRRSYREPCPRLLRPAEVESTGEAGERDRPQPARPWVVPPSLGLPPAAQRCPLGRRLYSVFASRSGAGPAGRPGRVACPRGPASPPAAPGVSRGRARDHAGMRWEAEAPTATTPLSRYPSNSGPGGAQSARGAARPANGEAGGRAGRAGARRAGHAPRRHLDV